VAKGNRHRATGFSKKCPKPETSSLGAFHSFRELP
jgi:hypothetical protein